MKFAKNRQIGSEFEHEKLIRYVRTVTTYIINRYSRTITTYIINIDLIYHKHWPKSCTDKYSTHLDTRITFTPSQTPIVILESTEFVLTSVTNIPPPRPLTLSLDYYYIIPFSFSTSSLFPFPISSCFRGVQRWLLEDQPCM